MKNVVNTSTFRTPWMRQAVVVRADDRRQRRVDVDPGVLQRLEEPVTTPPKSATSATARCAPVSRRSGSRRLSRRSWPGLHDDLAPHGVVRDPAVLVANDRVLARPIEAGRTRAIWPGSSITLTLWRSE